MRFEQMAFATYLQENANLVLAWGTVGHVHTSLGLIVRFCMKLPAPPRRIYLQLFQEKTMTMPIYNYFFCLLSPL